MQIQNTIESKLKDALKPEYLQVVNESDNHNVPAGSESHFKVTLVCAEFDGQMLIKRHRQVNAVLKEELANQIHALALHTYSPEEWQRQGGEAPESPECQGGSQ